MVASDLPGVEELRLLSAGFEGVSPAEVLRWAQQRFGVRVAIGTSFQLSGLVLLHQAATVGLSLECFTIDTDLLFPESVEHRLEIERFFKLKVDVLRPAASPEEQARELGAELWQRQPDTCCTLRKVVPLQEKLKRLDAWITGLRRDQGESRHGVQILESYLFDPLRDHYVLKINPLASWTRDDVWKYVQTHQIPYNRLLDHGYRSIGCRPCTRPAGEGGNERAGRWTGFDKAECGLHTFMKAHV
ncbi:MAG TPA: phosphoadenylyl-sulfate reductase [Chthoniobacterales bacterium]